MERRKDEVQEVNIGVKHNRWRDPGWGPRIVSDILGGLRRSQGGERRDRTEG